jgi:hypothetical protein
MSRPLTIGRPAAIGLAILLLCAACASPIYTIERYGTAAAVPVHLGCHDTYEVYDRPDAGSMLVGTNPVNEGISGLCKSGSAGLPKEERLRRVAGIFLEETSKRPTCRVTRETPLSPLQTEFNYSCAPPGTAASPTPQQRPRRG